MLSNTRILITLIHHLLPRITTTSDEFTIASSDIEVVIGEMLKCVECCDPSKPIHFAMFNDVNEVTNRKSLMSTVIVPGHIFKDCLVNIQEVTLYN
jgi:ribosomal protein S17